MKPTNGTGAGAPASPDGPASSGVADLDAAIGAVEQLLRAVTGREPPGCDDANRAPIPPEADVGRHLEGQIDRLLAVLPEARRRPTWAPAISLYELPQELLVTVDLPGVPRAGVEVTVDRGFLEVRGERAPRHRRRASAAWNEARTGAFCRRVPLPAGATSDGLRAELADGVLEVRIPVLAAAGAQRVAVQDGGAAP